MTFMRRWRRHRLGIFLPKFLAGVSASAFYAILMPPTIEILLAYLGSFTVGFAAWAVASSIYELRKEEQKIRTWMQQKAPKIAHKILHDPNFDPALIFKDMMTSYVAEHSKEVLDDTVMGPHLKNVMMEDDF